MPRDCDNCGCDEEDNDGPMETCPQCGLTLCRRCYGSLAYEWCRLCLEEERKQKERKGGAR